jgi:uncharacterized protein with GYD domain
MGMYLAHSTYTPEAWSNLIDNPEDRELAMRDALAAAGCKLHSLWFALSQPRGYALIEGDDISVAAFLAAADASGSVRHIEATTLLTPQQLTQALIKAQKVRFRAPQGDSSKGSA